MAANHHLDYDAIKTLKEIMEDDFFLLIDTFFQDSDTRILTLRTLLHSTDSDAIRRAAHSFKGSCSNLGALYLADLCGALEHKAVAGNLNEINVDLGVIEEEYALVKKMLLEYCP